MVTISLLSLRGVTTSFGRDVLELGLEHAASTSNGRGCFCCTMRGLILVRNVAECGAESGQGSSSGLHQIVEFTVVREGVSIATPLREHDAVGLRTRQQLGPVAGAEQQQVSAARRPRSRAV